MGPLLFRPQLLCNQLLGLGSFLLGSCLLVDGDDQIGNPVASERDSLLRCLIRCIRVLLCDLVRCEHQGVRGVLGVVVGFPCPVVRVQVLGQFFHLRSVGFDIIGGNFLQSCHILQSHWPTNKPGVVLHLEGAGIPESMQILRGAIQQHYFQTVATPVAAGVGAVVQRDRVQGLVDVADNVDEVPGKHGFLGGQQRVVDRQHLDCTLDDLDRAQHRLGHVDDSEDPVNQMWPKQIHKYLSMKCQSFHSYMLYARYLRSSGQHADSMKVRVRLSTKLLIESTISRNLNEDTGDSWFSRDSAMAAASMWPTSHHWMLSIGSSSSSNAFILGLLIIYREWLCKSILKYQYISQQASLFFGPGPASNYDQPSTFIHPDRPGRVDIARHNAPAADPQVPHRKLGPHLEHPRRESQPTEHAAQLHPRIHSPGLIPPELVGVDLPVASQVLHSQMVLEQLLVPHGQACQHIDKQGIQNVHQLVKFGLIDLSATFLPNIAKPLFGQLLVHVHHKGHHAQHMQSNNEQLVGSAVIELHQEPMYALSYAQPEQHAHAQPQNQPLQHLIETMCAQVHPGHGHQHHQQQRDHNLLNPCSLVLQQHTEACHGGEPAMPTRVAILDGAVYPDVAHRIAGPEWPGVTVMGLQQCCYEGVEQDVSEHDECFLFVLADYDQHHHATEHQQRVYGHGDQHEEVVQQGGGVGLRGADHRHAQGVQGLPVDLVQGQSEGQGSEGEGQQQGLLGQCGHAVLILQGVAYRIDAQE